MKVGDLVRLNGTMWSSYVREGETGLLLETNLNVLTDHSIVRSPGAEFSRVFWDNGEAQLYKTIHLDVVNESR